MTDNQPTTLKTLSRRRFLRVGAAAGSGAVLGIALPASAASQSSKVAKQTVSYQPSPRGAARCASCSFFQAPSSCNYVDGPISPTGWCVLYRAKG
jgi:secreted PhoX family phosphatase